MAAIGQTRPNTPSTTIRTPLFILGVGLALVAFLIMFAFGFIYVGRSSAGGTVRVLVASRDIGAREPITAENAALNTLPASAVPQDKAFTRLQDGWAATVAIYKGQPITTNLVANSDAIAGPQSSFLPIPKGYIAIALATGELQGVGGYPAQGDYLDVIASLNTGLFSNINPHTIVKTVFINLYILRVGPQSVVPRQGQPQGVTSSLTVLMTQCDAQYMVWLQQVAVLKYTLLSYQDYSTTLPTSPDPACPAGTAPPMIGPTQADARWGFSKGA